MALKKIELRPGIYKEGTKYSNQGGWYDCDKVRFRGGLPEKLGGWVQNNTNAGSYNPFEGTCRALISWGSLAGETYIGLGTSSKYYVQVGTAGAYADITPIRYVSTLASNAISTYAGTPLVSFNDPSNGSQTLDWLTISGVTVVFGGIPLTVINDEYQIVDLIEYHVTLAAGSMSAKPADGTKITITSAAHGLMNGSMVSFNGSTGFAGIGSASINGLRQVTFIDVDTFSINADVAASSTATNSTNFLADASNVVISIPIDPAFPRTTAVGGGSATSISYQISAGLDVTVSGTGWGAGTWGRNGWGSAYVDPSPAAATLRLWSHDNYDQDIVMCIRDGPIYYDALADITATPPVRAQDIVNIVGQSACPSVAREVCITGANNVIAFAPNPQFETVQDPMMIRWSASNNIADWDTTVTTNDAGSLRLSAGSRIITQIQTKQEVVVWTDIAMYSMKAIGSPYYYGVDQIGNGTSIIGPNAKSAVDDVVYWMGATAFYVYNGRISQIPCSVKDYVFSDINQSQNNKVCSGTNVSLGEVWWFYPSADSTENNRYVVYNYIDQLWFIGTLERTAWLDFAINGSPVAAGPYPLNKLQGLLYNHEVGNDDGDLITPRAMLSYIESSPFEIGDGDSMAFVRQVYPDITFRNSTYNETNPPSVVFLIEGYNYPGEALSQFDSADIISGTPVSLLVTTYTPQISLRLRARSVSMSIYSGTQDDQSGLGVAWRLGIPRLEMRTDGRR
jgi:hypothetical protein